jgi:hypothetical protein
MIFELIVLRILTSFLASTPSSSTLARPLLLGPCLKSWRSSASASKSRRWHWHYTFLAVSLLSRAKFPGYLLLVDGLGPLLFSPLSEIASVGRNAPYIITLFIYTMLWIGAATVQNFPGYLVLRFLTGFFGMSNEPKLAVLF